MIEFALGVLVLLSAFGFSALLAKAYLALGVSGLFAVVFGLAIVYAVGRAVRSWFDL